MIVGLTGGIGSGKTAVSDRFAALGITIVDADICARLVVEKGRPALANIADHFGEDVLDADGNLDRARLRQIVFANESERKWLESLLHPLIFDEMCLQLQRAAGPYAIFASPLLVESGQTVLCQRILVVDVPEELQLQRTMSRDNNTAEQVRSIIASQADRTTRLAKADDVITNTGSPDDLTEQVRCLHEKYLALAKKAPEH
ncbi:MAG TPA: dephospho-CoA kinase [Pseudomonadales bacterium]|nr:dephospho-CoA kinase [Pseudomonadales bacterium]